MLILPSVNGYDFNLDAMTSFEGDTGPYLQYAHARLCSMARKSELNIDELSSADFSLLTERHAVDLVRLLASWPDVLINTSKTLEPVTVLSYLFRMTHMLSSSYDVLKVIGSEPELKKARMALYAAARQVLNNGMRVLGLNPVERSVIEFGHSWSTNELTANPLGCKLSSTFFSPHLKIPHSLMISHTSPLDALALKVGPINYDYDVHFGTREQTREPWISSSNHVQHSCPELRSVGLNFFLSDPGMIRKLWRFLVQLLVWNN
jgi:hypothetical protein